MANAVPDEFSRRKQKILEGLAIPGEEYTDLSPKGSVDDGIRDLINLINGMEGLVTTSSCAGRISVFLEGTKSPAAMAHATDDQAPQVFVPGGKGHGGSWLFVSHEPVAEREQRYMDLFQLSECSREAQIATPVDSCARFVKLQFEPMILHVMAATLRHAQAVLAAAINAGMRESGIQSLPPSYVTGKFPMVAVRSAGLALSSVIGVIGSTGETKPRSLVDERYLRTMVVLANGRFRSNSQRIDRFVQGLRQSGESKAGWEDKEARAERKRAEGLRKQSSLAGNSPLVPPGGKEAEDSGVGEGLLWSCTDLFQDRH